MIKKCKACGQEPAFLFQKKGYKHFWCSNCGLVENEFKPAPDYFSKIYVDAYYKGGKEDWQPGYVDYAMDEKSHRAYFRGKIAGLKKLRPEGKLLDIGSALGFLLVEAKDAGYEVLGLDLSDYAISYTKENFDIETQRVFFEEAKLAKGSFDAVTIAQTLEHIPDPEKFLKKAHRILKPGGIVLIVVPNHESFWRRVLGRYWFQYKPQEHLFYFTPKSMKALLEKVGFEIVSMRSDDPMKFRLERVLERCSYYWNLPLFKTLRRASKKFGFEDLSVPIWMDDLEVIARKI